MTAGFGPDPEVLPTFFSFFFFWGGGGDLVRIVILGRHEGNFQLKMFKGKRNAYRPIRFFLSGNET